MRPDRRGARPWRGRLAVLAVSLLLGIGVLEIAPRLVPAFSRLRPLPRTYVGEHTNRPSATIVADPITGWRMRPHLSRPGGPSTPRLVTNAQGFRGVRDFEPSGTERRIILVGDSFTFGVGVELEQTFGAVLDRQLSAAAVYNLGMPGFGLDQMWLSLRHQALPLAPALVIVSFISESFPRSLQAYREPEGWNKPTFKLVDGALVQATRGDGPGRLRRFLEERSVLWRAADLASRAAGQHVPHGEAWHLNTAILRQMTIDAEAHGVRVLFVFIPTFYWRSFPAVVAYMRSLNAGVINLDAEPGFDMDRMYFPGDGHLNATGHQWLGNVLVEWIRTHLPAIAGDPATPPNAPQRRPSFR